MRNAAQPDRHVRNTASQKCIHNCDGHFTRRRIASNIFYATAGGIGGAPLFQPMELCGAMFPELMTYRHRLFETSFFMLAPPHPPHDAEQVKMGRPPKEGQFIQAVGNFSGVHYARKALDIHWMSQKELAQSIPPAFTEFIGEHLIGLLALERFAA